MDNSVVISLISGGTSIMLAIITVVVKNWLDAKQAKKLHEKDERVNNIDINEMLYINNYVEEFRDEFEFDRIVIAQFHNGGKFFNGKSMKKFSITYEVCAPGITKIKNINQNVLLTEYIKLFTNMFEKDILITDANSNFCNVYSQEMKEHGIVQNVLVPIKGLNNDFLGFISCQNLMVDTRLDSKHKQKFIDFANKISGYLIKK